MDKPCGRSAAGVMIAVSIAIRLIWAVSIDCTGVFNAAWICPIIGFVLFLPIGYAVKHISGRVPSAIRRFVFVIIA
ncbi:MAG: hypothetical protein IJA26_06405, partial [Clostridia bacterium]|nr:hypothetical protein [Clostridia bacterium]